ncbi:membrane-associated proteins in eicosanoid and glutathione metabolism [Russula ochroleuca]|jgi:glutathione S-transferase|uniref:Membrane-associated proteins in eicosanoid and glutathione metabolism n=1 Tax=Russula ochroleuca TaxID=152965 RepID=A0A9P5MYN4_9AGAM|nr:membrane-associated proteins in eicosanoid and glutathione metabolism [Russula ochroleuca]
MSTIYVPTGFSWVAASLVSVATLLQWQGISVGNARKKASIPYPQAYAEKAEQESSMDAKIFNCKQRAHQNTLENAPVMVVSTLIGGLRYPILSAALCGFWSFMRVLYTVRYGTGEPKKRSGPILISFFTQTVLSVVSAKVVFDLIKAGV